MSDEHASDWHRSFEHSGDQREPNEHQSVYARSANGRPATRSASTLETFLLCSATA
jgi:hypothetical protein